MKLRPRNRAQKNCTRKLRPRKSAPGTPLKKRPKKGLTEAGQMRGRTRAGNCAGSDGSHRWVPPAISALPLAPCVIPQRLSQSGMSNEPINSAPASSKKANAPSCVRRKPTLCERSARARSMAPAAPLSVVVATIRDRRVQSRPYAWVLLNPSAECWLLGSARSAAIPKTVDWLRCGARNLTRWAGSASFADLGQGLAGRKGFRVELQLDKRRLG
jgi:hypothetical protein